MQENDKKYGRRNWQRKNSASVLCVQLRRVSKRFSHIFFFIDSLNHFYGDKKKFYGLLLLEKFFCGRREKREMRLPHLAMFLIFGDARASAMQFHCSKEILSSATSAFFKWIFYLRTKIGTSSAEWSIECASSSSMSVTVSFHFEKMREKETTYLEKMFAAI